VEDSLKYIYQNYSGATSFTEYWYAFENYLDMCFPHLSNDDNFRKRLQRFEKDLKRFNIHDVFLSRIFTLNEAESLAELQPRIFRERNGNTSAHEAFASDYSRHVRGQKPKELICRLLNLLYTIRCNSQHGQKILPEEWDDIRSRNELIFSLTTPILAVLAELTIIFFVATGVFSYGTLKTLGTTIDLPCSVESLPGMKIKGHLYDLGRFPGWHYEMWGWVQGVILRVPLQFRTEFVQHCDAREGNAFERRLVVAYNADGNSQDIAWAYHYSGKVNISQRIQDGVWKGPRLG
jgi:gamma-glutamylcyclotransferase (GGCT)/AIG2-like uncharacterized protein YtfP